MTCECGPLAKPKSKEQAVTWRRRGIALCVAAFIIGTLGIWAHFYLLKLLHDGVYNLATLDSPSSPTFDAWSDNNDSPLDLDVYIYEITNEDDVINRHAKPIMQEIGPFKYRQRVTRIDIQWHEDGTLISWRPYRRYFFDRDASVDSDDRVIRTFNLPFAGLAAGLKDTEEGRNDLNACFNSFDMNDRLLNTLKIRDILFGYTSQLLDFLNWASEGRVKKKFDGLIGNDTSLADVDPESNWMWTGKDSGPDRPFRQLYKYKDWEYYSVCAEPPPPCLQNESVYAWGTRDASKVGGSEGAQIHPGVSEGASFNMWSPYAFRQVRYVNQLDGPNPSKTTYKGIDLYRFVIDPLEWENSTQNPAVAPFYQNTAPGLFNISSTSSNTPIFISRPHGRQVGPSIRDTVEYVFAPGTEESLDAAPEDYIDVEPITGTTFHVLGRVQVNLQIYPVPGMPNQTVLNGDNETWFSGLNPAIVPLYWVQTEVGINDDQANDFKTFVYGGYLLSKISLWAGIGLFVVCAALGSFYLKSSYHALRADGGLSEETSAVGEASERDPLKPRGADSSAYIVIPQSGGTPTAQGNMFKHYGSTPNSRRAHGDDDENSPAPADAVDISYSKQ